MAEQHSYRAPMPRFNPNAPSFTSTAAFQHSCYTPEHQPRARYDERRAFENTTQVQNYWNPTLMYRSNLHQVQQPLAPAVAAIPARFPGASFQFQQHGRTTYGHGFQETPIGTWGQSDVLGRPPPEQVKGQLIFGPPLNYDGDAPSQDAEVFVRIPDNVTGYDLLKLFERIGQVYKLRILVNPNGTNRGKCFVHYSSKYEAKQAIYFFKEYTLSNGAVIFAEQSLNNRRILIRGLPKHVTQQEILDEVRAVTGGVTSVKLFDHDPLQGRSAIIKYGSHDIALKALRGSLIGSLIARVPIFAEWAPSRPQRPTAMDNDDAS